MKPQLLVLAALSPTASTSPISITSSETRSNNAESIPIMAGQPRLRLALIGLGRLGAIRARILAFQQPRIELVAACDTKPGSDEWVKVNLPPSVKYYADPEDCMRNSGAKAILISTATATHAPLIIMGLDLGLVSLVEKASY